jgi:endonuclease YncB( thermonuclease family)
MTVRKRRRFVGAKANLKLSKQIETSVSSVLVLSILLLVSSNAQDLLGVERIIDGDTLLLTNGEYVRLIGVDTLKRNTHKNPLSILEALNFTLPRRQQTS